MRRVEISEVPEEPIESTAFNQKNNRIPTHTTRWTQTSLPERQRAKTYQKKKPFDALKRGLHIAIELALIDAYDRLGRIKTLDGIPIDGSSIDHLIEYALTNNAPPIGVSEFAKQLKKSGLDSDIGYSIKN